MFKIKKWFKFYLTDRHLETGLLIAALICFLSFSFGAVQVKTLSGISSPVATIVSGDARRKSRGTLRFSYVPALTPLYHRDVVWTAKNQRVTIKYQDGSLIELSDQTLVIIKKPFRSDRKLENSDRIELVRGKIKTNSLILSQD